LNSRFSHQQLCPRLALPAATVVPAYASHL
jgi:hypothetical protein